MNRRSGFYLWFTSILLIGTVFASSVTALAQDEATGPVVLALSIEGPLTQPMADYLERGIRIAEQRNAHLIILQLNTPGGSISLMNEMITTMRASNLPIVVYVSPRGALAGSAGTLITLAGHAAAMAPETAIGAASPVGAGGEDLGETIAAKEQEALKATVRTLTEDRPAEATRLAEETIETARAVSASEAFEVGMVDYIAEDVDDLLRQLDDTKVRTIAGDLILDLDEAVVDEVGFSFIEQLLNALTNPNIIFLLFNIGVWGILIELANPGTWVPGSVGVIGLALATYGLGILPVNWFGIIFLALAFGLFVLDINTPTYGALTAAGVASLIVGALVLFNTPDVPWLEPISVPLVVISSLFTGGVFFAILMYAIRAQRTPVAVGQESLVGRSGKVVVELNPRGQVNVAGENWSAELEGGGSLPRGARVQVVAVQGLRLLVRKAEE